MTTQPPNTRVTRIIARLNIGGPAIQAVTLTSELERFGYATRLIRGVEDPAEGSMDYLAERYGVHPTLIPELRRNPGPDDLVALARIVRLLRHDRPAVVHTHAAKGGTLGRLATLIAFPRRRHRPVVIHTYHGHSLSGYFSGHTAAVYRLIERLLAPATDVLLAVSGEVRDDLVRLKVAGAGSFRVMELGFELEPFSADHNRAARRRALRQRWGVGDEETVVTLIARLVPIKRVDRFLAVARQVAGNDRVRFVIVGDGELAAELKSSPDAVWLADRLIWTGFMREIADVCYASDVVMLTSDNEGTPVSLIEAQAAAVPVVATDVGGVRSVVADGEGGFLGAAGSDEQLAAALQRLLGDPSLRTRMGLAGRAQVTTRFTLARLVADHAALYEELLARRRAARQAR